MSEHVFVYGTLKRGLHNFHWMGASKFVGEAITVEGQFRMGDVGSHPEVTHTNSERAGFVTGELFLCDSRVMKDLDRLESNGVRYQRELIQVRLFGGESGPARLAAWIYLWICPLEPDVTPMLSDDGKLVYEWRKST